MAFAKSLVYALVAFHSFSFVLAGLVQKPGLTVPSSAEQHQNTVKGIFTDSYETYKRYAFGHDDVLPVSKGFSDGRNGWGATIVDAMSTMHIMGLNDLFSEAVGFASQTDFSNSKTSDSVSVFETTIRYIGGLLSAYELSSKQYPVLVAKAKQVADKLAYAWVDNNDVPFGHVNFSDNSPDTGTSNIAEAGTLTLEWATLSKYTGNDTYRRLAEKSAKHITTSGTPLPGLPAQGINPQTGNAVGSYVTWGGGSDSYFEYLIKYARLNSSVDPVFADSWSTAVDSSIRTLLKTSTVQQHIYLADYDSSDVQPIRHISSHLACFHGGNWLLGGRLLNNQTIVDHGLELTDACWNTYASTTTGIGPETFAFRSVDGEYTGSGRPPTVEQSLFYSQHGFYITASDYVLRPEVLESNFYAWRVTGDTKYLDRAESAVQSFLKYLPVQGLTDASPGYAGLNDVNNANSEKIDDTESFWFAEVLKYLYLTFDDPTHISLDEYVFNTEAHPFKVPSGNAGTTYGSGNRYVSDAPFKTTPGDLPQVSVLPDIVSNLVKAFGVKL